MDCSKTEVFLKELDRMRKETDCGSCRLCTEVSCGAVYRHFVKNDYLTLFQTVQKWSDEHPQETIFQHFKKILPNMPMREDSVFPACCPSHYDRRINNVCHKNCILCWNRPYEEAIRGSKE